MFLPLDPIPFEMVGPTPINQMSIDRNLNTTVVHRVLTHTFLPHGPLIPISGIVHQLGDLPHLLIRLISGPREKMFLHHLPQAPEAGTQETAHQAGFSNRRIHGNKHTMIALRESISKFPPCCLPLYFLMVTSSPSDRFFDRRGRASLDGPPDKPRSDRAPPLFPGGDRYRPATNKRDSFPPPRSDSYRPQYDTGWNPQFRREPISPASSSHHHRRDSGSFKVSRISDRHASPYANRPLTGKFASSPHTVTPPVRTPNWTVPDSDPWSYAGSQKQDVPSRAPSRSSIASTNASDRESPVFNVTPLPLPPSPSAPASHSQQTAVQRELLEIQNEPPSQPVLKVKSDIPKVSEPTKVVNGTPSQLAPAVRTEPTPVPKPVSSVVVKKQAPNVSIPAVENSHSPKQSLSIPSTILIPNYN